MTNNKLIIEIQYFEGCPNSSNMIEMVRRAIKQFSDQVILKETLIETNELANKLKFRGSPTLLIDGVDFENLPEPVEGNLACRYYKNGIPSVAEITDSIINRLKDHKNS